MQTVNKVLTLILLVSHTLLLTSKGKLSVTTEQTEIILENMNGMLSPRFTSDRVFQSVLPSNLILKIDTMLNPKSCVQVIIIEGIKLTI